MSSPEPLSAALERLRADLAAVIQPEAILLNLVATVDAAREALDGSHAIGFREGYRAAQAKWEAEYRALVSALEEHLCVSHRETFRCELARGALARRTNGDEG